MNAQHQALIEAAEACERAAFAYEQAHRVKTDADTRATNAERDAEQAISDARVTVGRKVQFAEIPRTETTTGDWSEDESLAHEYRLKAESCRSAAKMLDQ